jgi:hypothetical protein
MKSMPEVSRTFNPDAHAITAAHIFPTHAMRAVGTSGVDAMLFKAWSYPSYDVERTFG